MCARKCHINRTFLSASSSFRESDSNKSDTTGLLKKRCVFTRTPNECVPALFQFKWISHFSRWRSPPNAHYSRADYPSPEKRVEVITVRSVLYFHYYLLAEFSSASKTSDVARKLIIIISAWHLHWNDNLHSHRCAVARQVLPPVLVPVSRLVSFFTFILLTRNCSRDTTLEQNIIFCSLVAEQLRDIYQCPMYSFSLRFYYFSNIVSPKSDHYSYSRVLFHRLPIAKFNNASHRRFLAQVSVMWVLLLIDCSNNST